jgi:hypothetical protein
MLGRKKGFKKTFCSHHSKNTNTGSLTLVVLSTPRSREIGITKTFVIGA